MARKPTYEELEQENAALKKTVSKHSYIERIFHAVQHSVIILSPDQSIMSVNLATEKITGRTAESLKGMKCYELFHGKDVRQSPDNCPMRKMITSGRQETLEMEVETLKGVFLVSCTPVYDESGKLIRIIHIATDINETGRLQKAHDELELRIKERNGQLLQEKRNAQKLLDLIGVMVIGLDHEGKITLLNQKGCSILNVREQDVVGKNWFRNFLPQKHADDVQDVYLKLMKGEIEPVEYFENPVLTSSGELRTIAFHNTVIRNDNKIVGTLSSGEDITDKLNLENQLRQAHKMEALGTLAGGIAHDFNNILAIIMGNTDMALEDLPDLHPARHYLENSMTASLRARDLVEHILAYSRTSEKKFSVIQAVPIVKECLSFLRSSSPASVEILGNIDENCAPISGDRIHIHRIMINLFTNAQLAMKEKGGIIEISLGEAELSADDLAGENIKRRGVKPAAVTMPSGISDAEPDLKPGRYIRLSVSDTGCGIPPEIMERIFDPYFTTREFGKGSGMGLSIVHGIVKQHGGFIRVISELKKGTSFDVYFPVAA